MTSHATVKARHAIAGVGLLFTTCAWASISTPLMVQGDPYPAACTAASLAAFKTQIMQAPGLPLKERAWTLIRHYLCGENAASAAYVRQRTLRHIKLVDDSGGTKQVQTVGNRALPLPRQAAWGASIGLDPDELRVDFWPNEACVQGVTLRLRRGDWWIAGGSSACD